MVETWLPTCGAGAELYYNDPITRTWQPVCGAENPVYGNVNGEWVPLCCQVGAPPTSCTPVLLPMATQDPLVAGGYFINQVQWSNGDNRTHYYDDPPYSWLPTDTLGFAAIPQATLVDGSNATYAHAVITGSIARFYWGHIFPYHLWASFGPLSTGWHNIQIKMRVRITPHDVQEPGVADGHVTLRFCILDAGVDPAYPENMDTYTQGDMIAQTRIATSYLSVLADGSWQDIDTATPWSTTTAHGNYVRIFLECQNADIFDIAKLEIYEYWPNNDCLEADTGWTEWILPDPIDTRPSMSPYNDIPLPTYIRGSESAAVDWATSISRAMMGDESTVDGTYPNHYDGNIHPGRWRYTEFDYSQNGIYGGNNAYCYILNAFTYETRPNVGATTNNNRDGTGYTEVINQKTGPQSVVDVYRQIDDLVKDQLASRVPPGFIVAEYQYEHPVTIPAHPIPTEWSGSAWDSPQHVGGFAVLDAQIQLYAYTVTPDAANSITSEFSFTYWMYDPYLQSDTSFTHPHGSALGTHVMTPTSPSFQSLTVEVPNISTWFPDYGVPPNFGVSTGWQVWWGIDQAPPMSLTIWKARAEISHLGMLVQPGRMRMRLVAAP